MHWFKALICPIGTFARVFCLICLICPASPLWALQGVLTGSIRDADTEEALPGANVVLLNTELGAVTDIQGQFSLKGIPAGVYTVSFSMVGYAPVTQRGINIVPNDTQHLDVVLRPSAIEMPALVVSASKRARDIVDVPTSVTVIDGRTLETQNATSLDQSLEYAPGVNVVNGQLNVRGSSGYSRGVGSRVLLLIDGFPSLSADNGEIKWDAIPLDQIARIEIIKGAGSALYGTGALGGIVNIITRNPSPTPKTRVKAWAGTYSDPSYTSWEWAESRRYLQGIDISHSRQINTVGIVAAVGQKWTNGYRENDWHRRYKIFAKIRKSFSPTQTLNLTLNGAYDDHGVFVQWKDRNEPYEVPAQSRSDKSLSTKLNLALAYHHLYSATLGYRIRTYLYRTHFQNDLDNDGYSTGYKIGQEGQLDLQPNPDVSLTLGAEWIADRVQSATDLFGDHTGYSLASYAQAEWTPIESLVLSLGTRYDHSKTDSQTAAHSISPKLGYALEIAQNTALRGTLGWGFRSPSIAEIYTNATFSGVPIAPNLNLKPERAISVETGLNHRLSWAQFDVAVFYSRYRDLIEARPDAAGIISFRNVSKGRIAGLEISGQAALGPLQLETSYTFLDAVESLPGGDLPLPYRARRLGTIGIQIPIGPLTPGAKWTYRSPIPRGSTLFAEGTRDLIVIKLLDLSLSYEYASYMATLTVHNALAYNYARVERSLGPPRRFTISLAGTF